MFVILHALGIFVADMFKSRCRLQAENLFLRHQLNDSLGKSTPRSLEPNPACDCGAQLKALQRHALELVDPEAEF